MEAGMASIIVAVLAMAGTLGGSYLGVRQSNKLVEHRLIELEKKVDKHNNLVERVSLTEEKIRVANHRIEDLEKKTQGGLYGTLAQ